MATTDTNQALVKFDLSDLNETGETYDIYMLGYAASSGQIAQLNPVTKSIEFGSPGAYDVTVEVTPDPNNPTSEVTLEQAAALFVGGKASFNTNGQATSETTIKSIAAYVVCAHQTSPGIYQPFVDPAWKSGANAVVQSPVSIGQGQLANTGQTSEITNIPSTAASAAQPHLGALINGYVPPIGAIPTANAQVTDGQVAGLASLQNNNGKYRFPPTVSFPGAGVEEVATGICTLDASGCVSGVNMTAGGSGYATGTTYQATFSPAPGNLYFYPCDANNFPGPDTASQAASLTQVVAAQNMTSLQISQCTDAPSWLTIPSQLGPAAVLVYTSGLNTSGFATYQTLSPANPSLSTPNAIISDLESTSALIGYDPTNDSAGSSLMVSGQPASVPIYQVVKYVITLNDDLPTGTTSVTFNSDASGTIVSNNTVSLSLAAYPGIASALTIGQKIQFSGTSIEEQTQAITQLALSGQTITITLSQDLTNNANNDPVSLRLSPTHGNLPVYTWDATTNNAILAAQVPGATANSISVNGARIYFFVGTNGAPPPFPYTVGVNGAGEQIISVTQPADAQVWTGGLSPFIYLELSADALSPGSGKVYVDLSAVDGFIFPVALSTDLANGDTLLMGQVPTSGYTDPSGTSYNAVARDDILNAWTTYFGENANNFASGADALRQSYASLCIQDGASAIGIQNPTFYYETPDESQPAFDACWDTALDALLGTATSIDLKGDLLNQGEPTYYKGSPVTVGDSYKAIELVEYRSNYDTGSETGTIFWIFDPRNPPTSETGAFVLDNGTSEPMSVGYQVFANTGVFASNDLVTTGATPNYQASTGAYKWPTDADALKQLLGLQRDVVTALNRGVGADGLDIGTVGATTTYWNTETNWYPATTPFAASTSENLYSRWVHTAVIGDTSNKTFFATYPFGNDTGYQDPATAASGALMNQTYGFAYDETPNDGANVPSKFLPIQNSAGQTLTFKLRFGPWKS